MVMVETAEAQETAADTIGSGETGGTQQLPPVQNPGQGGQAGAIRIQEFKA